MHATPNDRGIIDSVTPLTGDPPLLPINILYNTVYLLVHRCDSKKGSILQEKQVCSAELVIPQLQRLVTTTTSGQRNLRLANICLSAFVTTYRVDQVI